MHRREPKCGWKGPGSTSSDSTNVVAERLWTAKSSRRSPPAKQVPATLLGVSTMLAVCVCHPVGSKSAGSVPGSQYDPGKFGEGQEFQEHGQAPHVLAKRPQIGVEVESDWQECESLQAYRNRLPKPARMHHGLVKNLTHFRRQELARHETVLAHDTSAPSGALTISCGLGR